MKTGQKRLFYLDVARVIASVSISLNHAANRSYQNYSGQMAEFLALPIGSTLFKTLITVFSHIGVPLFLMITGVLIFNKKMEDGNDLRKFYKHNLLSLFITAEIWYVLFYWYLVLDKGIEKIGWLKAIDGMFSTMLFQNQTTMDCMWYMPMILCVYATLPFAIMIKDKLSGMKTKKWCLPVVLLFLTTMVMPFVSNLLKLLGLKGLASPLEDNHLFSFYYTYIIVGYLIGKGLLRKLSGWSVALMTASSFLICCGYQLWAYSRPENYLVAYDFPLMPVCGGFLFELLRRGAERLKKLQRPVTFLSRIAFGIYFVHILLMTELVKILNQYAPDLHRPVRLLTLEIVSVGLSILIIWLLSKVKVLRKYLFLVK